MRDACSVTSIVCDDHTARCICIAPDNLSIRICRDEFVNAIIGSRVVESTSRCVLHYAPDRFKKLVTTIPVRGHDEHLAGYAIES